MTRTMASAPAGTADAALEAKLADLRSLLRGYGSVIVAYSGGVDSSFLMSVAHDVLGRNALAVTADSPSVRRDELAEATALAKRLSWAHRVIKTREMDDPHYVENGPRRCFFCKNELYAKLSALARDEGWRALVNGANADDPGDFRPGLDAAAQYGVHSPLVEAGLTKAEIRQLARRRALPTWDKPAQACLASRIPYGTPVSIEALTSIGAAERALRELGFRQLRVRHHGRVARIEVPVEEMARAIEPDIRRALVARLRAAGYAYVALDLAGFRSGSMNEVLPPSVKNGSRAGGK